jgi:hypothetical protein
MTQVASQVIEEEKNEGDKHGRDYDDAPVHQSEIDDINQ